MNLTKIKWHYNSAFAAKLLPAGQEAVCIGRHVFVKGHDLTLGQKKHEACHVKQWEEYGLFFPFLYAWKTIRFGYWNNPFEVEAREAE